MPQRVLTINLFVSHWLLGNSLNVEISWILRDELQVIAGVTLCTETNENSSIFLFRHPPIKFISNPVIFDRRRALEKTYIQLVAELQQLF